MYLLVYYIKISLLSGFEIEKCAYNNIFGNVLWSNYFFHDEWVQRECVRPRGQGTKTYSDGNKLCHIFSKLLKWAVVLKDKFIPSQIILFEKEILGLKKEARKDFHRNHNITIILTYNKLSDARTSLKAFWACVYLSIISK